MNRSEPRFESREPNHRKGPGAFLTHPVAAGSLVLLALNDRVLKEEYGTWWTGKLSDCAGMVVFPLLLLAVWDWGRWLSGRSHQKKPTPWFWPFGALRVCLGVTGLVFAAINLDSRLGAAYVATVDALWAPLAGTALYLGGARHTVDPTDLLALPFLIVPFWIVRQHHVA